MSEYLSFAKYQKNPLEWLRACLYGGELNVKPFSVAVVLLLLLLLLLFVLDRAIFVCP